MEKAKYRAYLCCGINCGPKGASSLVDFLEDEVSLHGLSVEVSVSATGCQAHCDSGPTMVVYPGPVFYQQVDRTRLQRILTEHFVGGLPVRDYFWTGVRRRILADGSVIFPRHVITPERGGGTLTQEEPDRRTQKRKPPPPEVDDFKW